MQISFTNDAKLPPAKYRRRVNIFCQNCLKQIINGVRVRNGISKGCMVNFVRNFVEISVEISCTDFTELNITEIFMEKYCAVSSIKPPTYFAIYYLEERNTFEFMLKVL